MCSGTLVEKENTPLKADVDFVLMDGTPEEFDPKYSMDGDSGFEVYAAEDAVLLPFVPTTIRHGVKLAPEHDFDFHLRSRSSSLPKRNILIQHGTLDGTYRGEVSTVALYIPPLGKLVENNPMPTLDLILPDHVRALYVQMAKLQALLTEPIHIKAGERISQVVVTQIVRAQFHRKATLDVTARGEGGFGHTGT